MSETHLGYHLQLLGPLWWGWKCWGCQLGFQWGKQLELLLVLQWDGQQELLLGSQLANQ